MERLRQNMSMERLRQTIFMRPSRPPSAVNIPSRQGSEIQSSIEPMGTIEIRGALAARKARFGWKSYDKRSSLLPTSFASAYSKTDKSAYKADGTGYLQVGASVIVHDIGLDETGTKGRYAINGVDWTEDIEVDFERYFSLDDLNDAMLEGLLTEGKPAWAKVRWIDVEGMNGEIIQHLLELIECDRQYTFDNIVNLNQRVMGLLLSDEDYVHDVHGDAAAADGHSDKFLMVTKVPALTSAALNQQNYKPDRLCLLEEDKIIEFEQISYILHNNAKGEGTLISFQQGIEGDCFGDIREMLEQKSHKTHRNGVGYLFMQLIKASTESAAKIERYLEYAIDQLQAFIENDPENIDYINAARSMQHECDMLERVLVPFSETLLQMSQGFLPASCRGNSKAAWLSLTYQLKYLADNISSEQKRLTDSVMFHKDYEEQKELLRQKNIEKSSFLMGVTLSIFSPLAFLTGYFGTNFQKSDGTPGLPELRWGWRPSDPNDPSSPPEWNGGITGYGYFWTLCGSIVVAILSMYIYAGLVDITPIIEGIKNFIKMAGGSCNACVPSKLKGKIVAKWSKKTLTGKVNPQPQV